MQLKEASMKVRNIVLALVFLLALVFARPEKADAGGYFSIGSYGGGISFGYGYGYYPSRYYYAPYYGYRTNYYRPYRNHYSGSIFYPTYRYYYKKRYHKKRRHAKRHHRYAKRHHHHHHHRRTYYTTYPTYYW